MLFCFAIHEFVIKNTTFHVEKLRIPLTTNIVLTQVYCIRTVIVTVDIYVYAYGIFTFSSFNDVDIFAIIFNNSRWKHFCISAIPTCVHVEDGIKVVKGLNSAKNKF